MEVLPSSSVPPSAAPSATAASGGGANGRNSRGPRRGGAQGGGNRRGGPLRSDGPPPAPRNSGAEGPAGTSSRGGRPGGAGGRRRAAFGGQLSEDPSAAGPSSSPAPSQHLPSSDSTAAPAPNGPKRSRNRNGPKTANGQDSSATFRPAPAKRGPAPPRAPPPSEDADLLTRLTYSLSHPPFADCSICFNSIHPAQPTWSCTPAPNTGDVGVKDGELKAGTACWGVFHLKCIKEWAEGSIRGGEEGGWRCPGCQTKRINPPKQYLCYCQSTVSPSPPRLSTPHSCASPCSRSRHHCAHPCPLDCHPGPCPACKVEMVISCGSHSKEMLVRCEAHSESSSGCGEVCGRTLDCGRDGHVCLEKCHEGPCLPCPITETLICFCGNHSRVGTCNELLSSSVECSSPTPTLAGTSWIGRYSCGDSCPQTHACDIHPCSSSCHPHPTPSPPCPRSPELVTHCPCGKKYLDELPGGKERARCTDKVKTCGNVCGRGRACGHRCSDRCHEGECEPCAEEVVIPCRCGESKVRRRCWQRQEEDLRGESEVRCEQKCHVLRSCRKHECGRVCCPLAYKAKNKGKRRAAMDDLGALEDEEGAWHTCQLVCGKTLPCGNHTCPALDHKGPCPPCLEASYEELVCHCQRTVILPPISCGRTFNCSYPCDRPPLACGHPKQHHNCHENEDCPPCVFLTTKDCACGKHQVKNTRCSQLKVSCGVVCGELLACGWHRCEKSCHSPGECEACVKPCSKPRRLCGHPCQDICHSPASCDIAAPCPSLVVQRCSCGRREQQAICSASTASPTSKERVVLKCSDDCHKAARNERLALALGISPDRGERGAVEWPQELMTLGLALGSGFVGLVEKSLADFISGPRANQILPHMPLNRREFVVKLAEQYRVDTSLVDQEPSRSVQLRRRVDSRIPTPLLSASISAAQAPASKSRLNTSRPTTSTASPAWTTPAASKPVTPTPRSWGNIPLQQPAPVATSTFTSARTSAVPSPAVSRTGSPYIPPARRAASPDQPSPANVTSAESSSTTVDPPPGLAAQVKSISLQDVEPSAAPVVANEDHTWEESDDEA